MQLLKMELRGFKSFADKTILTFDKGITAIVGPNGSGKSNISDAVRWVMGEQNVRQLRGQRAEDIIFAGTEKRRSQGVAEVSLYFDNTDHALDIEFTEVVVTRRLFRSGESEFYINKRPCRLKDIHMLFASTGIGQDSMAVIGQNRVDRILNSRPDERRIIFEEVAGISKYKGRKQEGLRKIAETERNLERIRDMMGLLTERMGPLEEQAKKVQQFRDLDSERISYEGTLTLQELRNGERLLAKAENYRIQALEEQETAQKELDGIEAKRKELLALMETEGERLRRLDGEALNAHNELDSMRSREQAFLQRQETLRENEATLAEEKKVACTRTETLDAQQKALAEQEEQKRAELEAARQGLALAETLLGAAEKDAQAATAQVQAVAEERNKARQELAMLQRDAAELHRRLQENRTRYSDVTAQLAQQQAAQEEACKQWHDGEAACSRVEGECKDYQAKVETERQRLRDLVAATTKLEEAYRRLRGTADSLGQRIRVLEGMEREHEGVGRAAKLVVDAAKPWRQGICGIVGEVCTIPQVYVTAIDIALGAASRYVITDNEDTAKQAIAYLKERHGGRTTFLPLDTIQERSRTIDEESAAHEPGMLGFASDVVTSEAAYRPIFQSLLGKTLLADTIETGAAVARKYRHRLRIVCLDGTQFNIGGSLTGGSVKGKDSSLISRRALLQELKEQEKAAQRDLEQVTAEGRKKRHAVDELQAAVQAIETKYQELTVALQKATWQTSTAQKEAERLAQLCQSLASQRDELQQTRTAIQAQLLAKEEHIEAMEERPDEDTQHLEEVQAKAVEEAARCRQTLTEGKIRVATLEEQVRHMGEQRLQHDEAIRQHHGDVDRLLQREKDIARHLEEVAQRITALASGIAQKEAETKSRDLAKEAFYKTREENFARSQKLEKESREGRERIQQCSDRVHRADVQLEKYQGDIRHYEELLAMQGLTRQEAMERRRDGSLKELHDMVATLKERIAKLGQINPNAEEEYAAAIKQHEFYTTQIDDLRQSRIQLEGIVAEIDEAMAAQFRQAFGQIGTHFQQIFSRLFGGGTAHLLLTDSQDVLQSGVDIVIQPPGKKQQQLTLLSGGERALTVIALLLAFLAYHPAPFCLVDEVDAALDEANVERMARYLKNYSGTTQFIVITHRRKTMEAANTLQGVTMEERGVSRLLTVKVDELLEKGN